MTKDFDWVAAGGAVLVIIIVLTAAGILLTWLAHALWWEVVNFTNWPVWLP